MAGKTGAVQFARRFLVISLVSDLAYFLFWIAIILPSEAVSFAEMGWYHHWTDRIDGTLVLLLGTARQKDLPPWISRSL